MGQTQGKAQFILTVIAASLVVIGTLQLIFAIFNSPGDQIILLLVSLLYDVGFLYSIVKQWKLGLKIYNVAVRVAVVLSAIALIFCLGAIAFESGQENAKITPELTSLVAIHLLFYIVQAYLLRKYLSQIEQNEGYTSP